MLEAYIEEVGNKLKQLIERETDHLKKGASEVARSIKQGGIVQIFGCGHSHLLSEEVFYRAGGLVPVKPILIEPLMLHEGAVRSSLFERKNDYAAEFLEKEDFRDQDIVIVISTSGRNPVPVDVALHAKKKGAFVIAITSVETSKGFPSRHKSGKHLSDCADLLVDNLSVAGDAIMRHDKVPVPFTPTSTILGAAILNGLLSEAIVMMAEEGITPPIFLSGNVSNADHHNFQLIKKYENRIPLLSLGLDEN
ncbi:SIS domain-containing protein [Metabacillus sp. RGM 3146]|uniref:SIS domain-containing protein n=1 Tax=Metabacillus sp. RGM 3146 TaxID=3401092 RepID=UPI003B9AFAB2